MLSMLYFPAVALAEQPLKPLSIETIQVIKIAGRDERAVIKTPEGKLEIIKVGDPVGDHAKLTEITDGRVEGMRGHEGQVFTISLFIRTILTQKTRQRSDSLPAFAFFGITK